MLKTLKCSRVTQGGKCHLPGAKLGVFSGNRAVRAPAPAPPPPAPQLRAGTVMILCPPSPFDLENQGGSQHYFQCLPSPLTILP